MEYMRPKSGQEIEHKDLVEVSRSAPVGCGDGIYITYNIPAEKMPARKQAYVMQARRYSYQPDYITKNADGSGTVTLFWYVF